MKRLLILLALTGAATGLACGKDDGDDDSAGDDDDDDAPNQDASTTPRNDAGTRNDSGSAPATVKIENVGAACKEDKDCKGPMANCETEITSGGDPVPLEGGYCTANCTSSVECGNEGLCTLTELTMGFMLPGFDVTGGLLPSYCLAKCDAQNDCRGGYDCRSIGDLVPAQYKQGLTAVIFSGAAWRQTYCIPPIELDLPDLPTNPRPDAGAADAGSMSMTRLDGGLDAGR